MDSVPVNVHLQILFHLSLNEIAECRLVTRSFKQVFEESLKHVTCISAGDEKEWSKSHSEGKDLSYIRQTFFSKPFIKAHIQVESSKRVYSRFFKFLAKFCPNLRVLRMHGDELSCRQLLLLPPRLEFISCDNLSFRPRKTAKHVQSLCAHLPNLQGFIYYYPHFRLISDETATQVSKELLRLNRPICQICRPRGMDEELVQLLARGGIKYLHMCKKKRFLPSLSISQPLAESLVGLSLDFFPTGKHCSFSLPNLLFLEVAGHEQRTAIARIESFLSTPNLTHFIFRAETSREDFCRLMDNIHSLHKLRLLALDFTFIQDTNSDIPLISLPHNLHSLTVETDRPFRFSDDSSLSLKRFWCSDISELHFDFPNLELLSCETKLSPQLLESLSKCGKLRTVKFKLRTTDDSVSLQPLVDLLCSMDHLQMLSLSCSSKTPTIHLELHEDHSLTDLRFKLLETELVLHLFGLFRFLQFRQPDSPNFLDPFSPPHLTRIRLKGPRKELKVLGFCPVAIRFNE